MVSHQQAQLRERPGPFYHVNDISVYLSRQRGRGGGPPIEKKELEALSCSFCPKRWSFKCLQSKNMHMLNGYAIMLVWGLLRLAPMQSS